MAPVSPLSGPSAVRHRNGMVPPKESQNAPMRAKIPERATQGGMQLGIGGLGEVLEEADSVDAGRLGHRIRSRIEAPWGSGIPLSVLAARGESSFACELLW